MVHILGRQTDLAQREPRSGEQRLDDVLRRWSLEGNGEWLDDGVRRGEAFLQVSAASVGSVLAWELDRIQAAGYVAVGPYWLPASWHRDGESYRRVLRLVAEFVLALPAGTAAGDDMYVPKARGELEPMLALWPQVVALPMTTGLSMDELIVGRAFPVHPLGVVLQPAWADGRMCSPAEFFFHDLDHARFKVREDLLALGVEIEDAYRDGTTIDPANGKHRVILSGARDRIGPVLWQASVGRHDLARRLLASISAEPDRDLAAAARWLAFELLHEKSLPLDTCVLRRELASTAHVDKLRAKCASGFYAAEAPAMATIDRLDDARHWLDRFFEAQR
ncbi:MAG TPA: hypothetical protein VK843_19685 [Planctomycetota bacterium]|nr:hypothetical protein [Planctomycetota bacterium]